MSWIWQNYSKDNKFIIHKNINPYTEVLNDTLDTSTHEIIVNTLIRFSEIFSMPESIPTDEEFYQENEDIFNVILHFLAQNDLLSGLSYIDIIKQLIHLELLNGNYGKEIATLYNSMNCNDQTKICDFLYEYHSIKESKSIFNQVFLDMFKYPIDNFPFTYKKGNIENSSMVVGRYKYTAEIYYQRSTNTTYCYCGLNDTQYNRNKFKLIRLLFADILDNIIDIWGYCFGIIGETREFVSSIPKIGEFSIL